MVFIGEVMKKKKYKFDKLFEFRVKYNASSEHIAMNNYHYYMAHNSEEAIKFHDAMLDSNKITAQTISVEKYNPYSEKWEMRNV